MSKWVQKWEVEGSKGNVYTVACDEHGNYGCSCPAWKFRKQDECKHIKEVKARRELEKATRVSGIPPLGGVPVIPGNVPHLKIYMDSNNKPIHVLYPLVPFGRIGSAIAATVVYDMVAVGVPRKIIRDYIEHIFGKGQSMAKLLGWVQKHGRCVYSRWNKNKGWHEPVLLKADSGSSQNYIEYKDQEEYPEPRHTTWVGKEITT